MNFLVFKRSFLQHWHPEHGAACTSYAIFDQMLLLLHILQRLCEAIIRGEAEYEAGVKYVDDNGVYVGHQLI